MKGLVLSVFPGIDMLGRGFEAEGFCVVRGPDLIFGGDIRGFHVPGGVFVGVIGGSPCPDFSRARRGPPTGDGVAMLAEFRRVVTEAAPDWYLLENVPAAPDLRVSGYSFQRVDVDARDVGLEQRRLRHFQFGHAKRFALCLPRPGSRRDRPGEPTCMASEARRVGRRSWSRFCQLQGLPGDFQLPSFTLAAKYAAVGNGVPLPVGRALARGILFCADLWTLCECGCARPIEGKQRYASVACRKRAQRVRDRVGVTGPGPATAAASQSGQGPQAIVAASDRTIAGGSQVGQGGENC